MRWSDGSVERHEYGPSGSFYRFTDAAGGVTTVARVPGSRREETTDPIGRTTVVEYSESGLPVLMTDASGATASFAYDDLGRMVERIDAQLGTNRFEYLADTELLRLATYPDGTQLLLDYDGQRNLIAVRDTAGPASV